MSASDTIYALATPPGKSGVAVVRVSGPQAFESLSLLIGGKEKISSAAAPTQAIKLCKLLDPVSRETIDKALVATFANPRSFTGEDVVEYHLHGSPAVIKSLLSVLSGQKNHRLAEPGEFTRRAFENGKMDLTGAEAVADLINAETEAQKAQALSQMEGSLSRLYDEWRETLTKTLAHAEADLEFPDEDMPEGIFPQLRPGIEKMMAGLEQHLDDNRRGERLRDGVHVAVIGAPNAGKSTLVNALAQRDVAIVSDLAGTTRDVIEVHLDLGGYPVILSDTAGLRPDQIGNEGQDSIESEGIRRALQKAEAADIRLLMFDGTQEKPDSHTAGLVNDAALYVVNKKDKAQEKNHPDNAVFISAETGEGLDQLTGVLIEKIEALIGSRETPSLTRQRHRDAIEECRSALSRALEAELPELMAEDLRLAIRALGRITGKVDVEDLLDVIFKDFCIGK